MAQKEISFEAAFEKLEAILEKMNGGQLGLEESLKLYEDANGLIQSCTKRLGEAEKKIQILIKQRDGSLATDDDQNAQMEDFSPQ